MKQAQDNERLCEILDMFLESSEVTMDFVIKSGGKTVKALRGSQDPDVRKKAIALTAQWKVLVTGQLAKKAAKKEEKDAGSEDEAGETFAKFGPANGDEKKCVMEAGHACWTASFHAQCTSWCTCRVSASETGRGWAIGSNSTPREKGGAVQKTLGQARAHTRVFAASTMHVLAMAAASMMLLTRHVDCYAPPPAPHHFFAAGAPPASGSSSSKIPALGQLARPRQGVVLKGDGNVLKQRVRGLNCNASKFSPPKGKPVIYWSHFPPTLPLSLPTTYTRVLVAHCIHARMWRACKMGCEGVD